MALDDSFNKVLSEYLKSSDQALTQNPLAAYIRHKIPNEVSQMVGPQNRYICQGSPGQGNWAAVPWVGIFDRLITTTAQKGYYLVYLFREDMGGLYLSLNQGVTTVKAQYGSDAKTALKARSANFHAQLKSLDPNLITGEIDLAATSKSGLGSHYEVGSICAYYYPNGSVPNEATLAEHLKHLLSLYAHLASLGVNIGDADIVEDDEVGLDTEHADKIRAHKRIERNKKLSKKAKQIHGYTCQVCDFNFESFYGEIGRNFIEAHHLVPLSNLKGTKVRLSPRDDFAVLCPNCHRMIHKTDLVSDVAEFRRRFIDCSQS